MRIIFFFNLGINYILSSVHKFSLAFIFLFKYSTNFIHYLISVTFMSILHIQYMC